jgi:hypothetical protein
MSVSQIRVAVNRDVVARGVYLADHDRSSLVVTDRGGGLWHVDARHLQVRSRHQLGGDAKGAHAVRPADGAALLSGGSAVSLLDRSGIPVWTMRHLPWDDYASGAAWFDRNGRPFALVPSPGGPCDVVQLDESTGSVLRLAPVPTAPSGLHAIHHPDGWVGLSVGEGQDGAFAWWVRLGDDRLEVVGAPWDDEVLIDVDPNGTRILTTPHEDGPIKIRSFPDLAVVRELDPPSGHGWDFDACFAGDHVVAKAVEWDAETEVVMAIDPDRGRSELVRSPAWISPGPDASWITSGPDGLERWSLA